HEWSGGMKQRGSLAAAVIDSPQLVIADEPTTALDVRVQSQILDLVTSVRANTHSSLIWVSHDLAVVSHVSDRLVVMYAGFVVEEGPTADLLRNPAHPYTEALVSATPTMDTPLDLPLPTLPGSVPTPSDELEGCYFAPRCPKATAICFSERPDLRSVADNRS